MSVWLWTYVVTKALPSMYTSEYCTLEPQA